VVLSQLRDLNVTLSSIPTIETAAASGVSSTIAAGLATATGAATKI